MPFAGGRGIFLQAAKQFFTHLQFIWCKGEKGQPQATSGFFLGEANP